MDVKELDEMKECLMMWWQWWWVMKVILPKPSPAPTHLNIGTLLFISYTLKHKQ